MIHILPPRQWPIERRILHWIVLALRISMVLAIIVAVTYGLWEVFFLSILTLALMLLPEAIESRVQIHLPIEFDLVLVLFIYASLFLGSTTGVYELIWWWDLLLHVSAGFILSFAGFLILYVNLNKHKITASKLVIGLFIFSFGMAFSAVWEIYEFAVDRLFGLNMQRGSLEDTMWDLIVTLLGAVFMAYIGIKFVDNPRQGLIAKLVQKFMQANPKLKGKSK